MLPTEADSRHLYGFIHYGGQAIGSRESVASGDNAHCHLTQGKQGLSYPFKEQGSQTPSMSILDSAQATVEAKNGLTPSQPQISIIQRFFFSYALL